MPLFGLRNAIRGRRDGEGGKKNKKHRDTEKTQKRRKKPAAEPTSVRVWGLVTGYPVVSGSQCVALRIDGSNPSDASLHGSTINAPMQICFYSDENQVSVTALRQLREDVHWRGVMINGHLTNATLLTATEIAQRARRQLPAYRPRSAGSATGGGN